MRYSRRSLSMLWTGNNCKLKRCVIWPFRQSKLELAKSVCKLQAARSVHALAKNCLLLHIHLSGLALQSE
jgi:hypothetical protein